MSLQPCPSFSVPADLPTYNPRCGCAVEDRRMVWNWFRLFSPDGLELCEDLLNIIRRIITSPEFRRRQAYLDELLDAVERGTCSTKEIKRETYTGYVWVRRSLQDLGNYWYSFVYQILLRKAENWQSAGFGPLSKTLARCVRQWPLMEKHAPDTNKSWSLKGDFIEFMLQNTRETADAEDFDLRQERLALNRFMVAFEEKVAQLDAFVVRTVMGPPLYRDRPSPDIAAQCVLTAIGAVRSPSPPMRAQHLFVLVRWANADEMMAVMRAPNGLRRAR